MPVCWHCLGMDRVLLALCYTHRYALHSLDNAAGAAGIHGRRTRRADAVLRRRGDEGGSGSGMEGAEGDNQRLQDNRVAP